jgi:hypothetical protein
MREVCLMWDEILQFYEERSQSRRKGEMWDKIRHHSRKMQEFIPKIQKHPKLSKLEARISAVELGIANPDKRLGALIFMEYNDQVRIVFYEFGKLLSTQEADDVHVHISDAIQVLEDNLIG